MVLSRIFRETDAKGREHISKQYIQRYDIKPFSEFVTFTTTRNRAEAMPFTAAEAKSMLKRLNHLKQKFSAEQ